MMLIFTRRANPRILHEGHLGMRKVPMRIEWLRIGAGIVNRHFQLHRFRINSFVTLYEV